MRNPFDRISTPMIVMLAALALLPAIAVLQYRWIGSVSEAEGERQRTALRANAMRFRADVNSLFDAPLRTLAGQPGWRRGSRADAAELCAHWLETAPERGAVTSVFLARTRDEQKRELLQFDRDKRDFVPVDWPARLAELEERLTLPPRPMRFADLDPFLLVAFLPPGGGRFFGGPGRGGEERRADWDFTIIELNREYLEQQALPEIVARHFDLRPDADFHLRVVSRADPSKVVFRSGADLADSAFIPADISMAVGGGPQVRFRPGRGGFRGGPPGFGPEPFSERLPGPEPGPGPPPSPGDPRNFENNGIWQIELKHRSGSLETAVANVRNRNLAVSMTVLALMAAAIGVLFISARRAQQLAKLQMEFVAGVSHELRTPLAVICSSGFNLAEGVVAEKDQVKRYGSVIHREGKRLTSMVEQVLSFASLESGQRRYASAPVDVTSLVDHAVEACAPEIKDAECNVERHVAAGLEVQGDEAALTQALRNLVANAAVHGRSGKWIGVNANRNNGWVEISVNDRGPGIAPGETKRIFEPFVRGTGALERQVRGTGLGLSLVKSIVEGHGGSVTVSSGAETSFTVRLPAASGESNGSQNSTGGR